MEAAYAAELSSKTWQNMKCSGGVPTLMTGAMQVGHTWSPCNSTTWFTLNRVPASAVYYLVLVGLVRSAVVEFHAAPARVKDLDRTKAGSVLHAHNHVGALASFTNSVI